MAAGASIGSIYARIGADTSDLQAKLAQANTSLGRFAKDTDTFGRSASTGLGQAGATAGQVARRVSAMGTIVDQVTGSNSAGYIVVGHSALEMGRSVLEGAGAVTKLGVATQAVGVVIKGFGAGPVAGAILASLALGGAVGTVFNKFAGLGYLLQDIAHGPTKDFGDSLAKDETLFRTTVDQVEHLKTQLHLSGPEWAVNTTRTKESATQLAAMVEQITQHGRVVMQTKNVRDGYTQSFIDLGDKIRANQKILADYTAKVNETYGIVTKSDVTAKLKTTLLDLRVMQKEGIEAEQVIAAAGPAILEVIDKAKLVGVDVPLILGDMADAIKTKNNLWVGDLLRTLPGIPKEAADAAKVAGASLDEMGKRLEGSISGGFGRGIESGTNFGKQQLDAFIADVEGRPIKLRFDTSDLNNAIADALSGRARMTPGRAPA